MGVPADRNRNELDSNLCDELDHGGLRPQIAGNPSGLGDLQNDRTDISAGRIWVRSYADFVVDFALDVSTKDLSEDLSL